MSPIFLDDTVKFPCNGSFTSSSSNADNHTPSIEEYAHACSRATDEAKMDWAIAGMTTNASVKTGFFGKLRSTLWTQEFHTWEDPDGAMLKYKDLLESLEDIFSGENSFRHATQWDDTFAGASLVAKLSEKSNLIYWKFNAPPLAGRDMLFLVHRKKEVNDAPDYNSKDNNWEVRVTYAYASVNDEWAKKHGFVNLHGSKRVRALNCFPSCDRIRVRNDTINNTKKIISIDHLMTTDVGGWVRPFCFNNLFKRSLIQANMHECEKMRNYILSLSSGKNKSAGYV